MRQRQNVVDGAESQDGNELMRTQLVGVRTYRGGQEVEAGQPFNNTSDEKLEHELHETLGSASFNPHRA
jgi:hypothetical protein